MKIGLVLPNTPGYSETFFRNKIRGLQQEGHEVLMYVNNPKGSKSYLNCKVIKSPQLNGNPLVVTFNIFLQLLKMLFLNTRKSLELYQLNKKDGLSFYQNLKQILSNQFMLYEQLDWLHYGFGTMVLDRENVARAIGAKMAVSFRGFDYYVYPVKNKNCYSILFSKKVKYHVLSEGMKKGLMLNGIVGDAVFKITPAIDLELFDTKDNKRADIIQIKTVARLHWIKGLEYTIEALSLLKKEGVAFHYTIIGDGLEKERLQFAVHQLGLNGCVTFSGKLSQEAVKEALATTDLYLQYSIQEGFCNAVLEAQAMGLLCIVSDAEGLSENVIENETGFVVEKQKPTLLFEKIKEVIGLNETQKEMMRKQAVLRVEKEFNLEKQQKEFLAFYTE